jgi:hypothetical protein
MVEDVSRAERDRGTKYYRAYRLVAVGWMGLLGMGCRQSGLLYQRTRPSFGSSS